MKKSRDGTRKARSRAGIIFRRSMQIVACCVLVAVLTGVGIVAWTATHLDDEADMEVMEAMRGSRTSRLYYPAPETARDTLSLQNYRPIEYDILYGDENMVWAQSEELPEQLKNAFVAIEDQRFYTHHGVDWRRTGIAALNHIFRFRPQFGGSTITQQLIKNVHGDREVTAMRKLKEIIRALRLEKEYDKDEILTYYLNIVPLGHGCIGAKSASRYYFGKSPSELTAVECAALAAITNAPSYYEPAGHMENNDSRRALVLSAMRNNGYLNAEEYRLASETALKLDITDPIYTRSDHNWYTETVVSDVIRDLSRELGISDAAASAMLYRGGLEVYTLMDARVQNVMDGYFGDISNFPEVDGKQINGAMVLADPGTGDLLGVCGGVGEKSGARLFNRATDGYYPPGSALKPLSLYAPALDKDLIHYATVFDDLPGIKDGELWPRNSPNVYAGYIGAHEALAKSKNTVAVQILDMLGRETAYETLRRDLHFTGLVRGGQSKLSDYATAPLALGQLSYGTTVREMTAAFGVLANGGIYEAPRSYLAVYDAKGKPLLVREREENRVWSEDTASIMTQMLTEVTDYGTAHRVLLKEMVDTAGKTGTSGADRDKWFVGYTPYFVAGFHCSVDDMTPLPASTHLHLTVWDDVMRAVHDKILTAEMENPRGFSLTEGVVRAEYCLDSGEIPTDACRAELRGVRTGLGYFKVHSLPQRPCDRHTTGHFDLESEQYGIGEGQADTALDFYVLTSGGRKAPEGIVPQDTPYTIEHLMKNAEKDTTEMGDGADEEYALTE